MSNNLEYRAFISYSQKDQRWCDWLHRAIETYSIPSRLVGRSSRDGSVPRRIFPIFKDRDELSSSADLKGSVADALQRSRYLVVICSPYAAASPWVNEEIRRFKAMGRTDRILCLIVDGDPAECFPPALFDPGDAGKASSSEQIEPLAADLRKGHDGVGDAKLKIIAGLLGLSFDELKQREKQRQRQSLIFEAAIAGVLTSLLLLPDFGPVPELRLFALDAYQAYFPRVRKAAPAVIVTVDEASLARVGQWPWPRDMMARLVTKLAAYKPAAIGIDILFSEPDRLSPERLAEYFRIRDPIVADRLAKLRSNDTLLVESIRSAPVILGVAGLPGPTGDKGPYTLSRQLGPKAPLEVYGSALRSLPELDQAAAGHGLLSAQLERGVVRRVPLVGRVGEDPMLSLALECLRIAAGEKLFTLESDAQGLRRVSIGDLTIPTQSDGRVWLHFSPHDASRFISAADLLEGSVDAGEINRKLIFVSVTGLGLVDYQTTAGGERMPGVEIHAQLIESIFDDSLLSRPEWARLVEALTFALLGAVIIVGVPHVSPGRAFGIPLACSLLVGASGIGAFLWSRALFDWATPIVGINVLFAVNMTYSYVIHGLRQSIDR